MANETAKQFMARVKALRKAIGLSQEEFAERAGLKYKHYQSVEAGRKLNLHIGTLEKIAKACGLSLGELFSFGTPLIVGESELNEDPKAPKMPRSPKQATYRQKPKGPKAS